MNIIKTKKEFDIQKASFILMLSFCIMPILMTIYCFVMGATGRFQSDINSGASYSYILVIKYFLYLYRFIGIISIITCITFLLTSNSFSIKGFKENPWFFLFALLILWSFISTSLSKRPFEQLMGTEIICDGLFTYLVYASVFIFSSILINKRHRKILITFFTTVISYLSIIMLFQESGNEFIRYCFPTLKSAIYFNSNYFGYVLCISIVALLGLYIYTNKALYKVLFFIEFSFQFYSLLVNNTFGCYLAVVFSIPFVYMFCHRNNKRMLIYDFLPIIVVIVLSFGKFSFSSFSDSPVTNEFAKLENDINAIVTNKEGSGKAGSGRWGLWVASFKKIWEKPIFGFGPEAFTFESYENLKGSPHNDILQIAAYLGIPGLVLYVSAITLLYLNLRKNMKLLGEETVICMGVVVCYLISSLFGHPTYSTTPYFWMFLGIVTNFNENSKPFLLQNNNNVPKYKAKIVILLLLFIIVCFSVSLINSNSTNEQNNELIDLYSMKNAHLNAELLLKKKSLKEISTFWYDDANIKLIPITDSDPVPCGRGTPKIGGGIVEYSKKFNDNFAYDESKDYSNKILIVKVDPIKSVIELTWE